MKTPKEFEYDLFKNEQGEFCVKIKRTGDVTKVSIEVFRTLRNESMRIYRENKGIPIYKKDNESKTLVGHAHNLSLDYYNSSEFSNLESSWLSDKNETSESILLKIDIDAFKKILTEKQLDLFECCIEKGQQYIDYANENNIDKTSVRDRLKAIRKKAEIFFK